MKNETSGQLTEKFNQLFAGGHTNYRVPLQITENRLFINKAQGGRVWDLDGREYVDYIGAMGPNILGHRHPEWVEAIKELLDTYSTSVGSGILQSTDDIELAERLIRHIPCAEKIKTCITGTEAVQMALRLSRAYTGRPYFIRFSGHYHGWMDNVLGGLTDPSPTGKPFAVQDPDSDPIEDYCFTKGKAANANNESFLLPWNDIEVFENTVEKYGDQIAMVHFEAVVCNHFCLMPKPGYLERIRELCTKYGIIMSIDEVITGFRVGLGGAQELLNVTPDIATFGKAIAGGVPFSAVMGKKEIMAQLDDQLVLGPGTFNGYPLGIRAALATVKILEKDNGAVYQHIAEVQNQLETGLKEVAKKNGIPMFTQGIPGVFFTIFGSDAEQVIYTDDQLEEFIDYDVYMQFWSGMQENGILQLAGGRWYPSAAHSTTDIEKTLEAADKVMAALGSKGIKAKGEILKNDDPLVGYRKTWVDDILYMEFGQLTKDIAIEAATDFKKELDRPETQKAIFIARKGAKVMGPAFSKFSKEVDKYEGDHLKALAITVRNKAARFIVEKLLPKDDPTDIRIFLDEEKAVAWLSAYKSKEQSEIWLKEN